MKRIVVLVLALGFIMGICSISSSAMSSDVEVLVFDSAEDFYKMFVEEAGDKQITVVKSMNLFGEGSFYVVVNNKRDEVAAEDRDEIILPPREGNESSLDVIDPIFD